MSVSLLVLSKRLADPFTDYVAANGKGAVVKGVVREADARGVAIDLVDGVDGYLRAAEISRDHVADASALFSVGDEVESKITSIDRKTRRISLSIKALEAQHESEAIEEYGRGSEDTGGSSLLAEKLKEQLKQVIVYCFRKAANAKVLAAFFWRQANQLDVSRGDCYMHGNKVFVRTKL